MKLVRRFGLLVAAVLSVTALTGTAVPANATTAPKPLTYHGVILGAATLEGPGCVAGRYVGTWTVDVPDRRSDAAVVTVNLRLDGQPHAEWQLPFTLTAPAAPNKFSAALSTPWGDSLTVSMRHWLFVFTLDSPDYLQCSATFWGIRTP